MSKKLKIYQVLTFALGLAFVTLCLFVGITAIQKSMKLNISFTTAPSILVKIELYNTTTSKYDVIFQNAGTIQIGDGLELDGNTLNFTSTFASSQPSLGASFNLRFTNLMTDIALQVAASGTGVTSNPSYLVIKESGSDQDAGVMTVSGNSVASTLQLSFSVCNSYTIATSSQSDNFTFSGEEEAAQGEDYTANIKAKDGYELTISITKDNGATTLTQGIHYTWDSSSGELIIDGSAVTGDIIITCLCTIKSYTIEYNLNGGDVATVNPTSYTIETNTFTLNAPTKTGYDFAGWTGSNGATPQTSVSIAKGSMGNRYYTATWTAKTYTITYSLSSCTSSNTATSIKFGEIYTTTITPDGHCEALMLQVVLGVSQDGYTWNSSTGVLTIDGSKITGNITIGCVGM